MTKTNEEIYKMAIDFVINSKHGTDEETQVMVDEIHELNLDGLSYFMGNISGLLCGIMDFSLIGKLEEPILREFLNQRYLTLKKDGAFND